MVRPAASFSNTWRGRERWGATFPTTPQLGRGWGIALLTFIVWAVPSLAWGQKVPVGSEFEVNTYTTEAQGYWGPKVVSDSAGNFVVVWANYDGPLYMSRFNSSGVPLAPESRVTDYGKWPAASSDPAGAFVVVWNSYYCEDTYGVCARRFDSTGTSVGSEFLVSTGSSNYFLSPKVASDQVGNFVVVWSGTSSATNEHGHVWGRRFDSSGTALDTTEFQVTTSYSPGCCYTLREDWDGLEVASSSTGNFMVVWSVDGAVVGRAFDSAGSPASPEFQIDSGANYQEVGIAADGAGRFIVVWDENADPIRGRRFDSTGTPVGAEFQVSESSTNYPYEPRVAADAAGGFVVVWTEYERDGSGPGVVARQFDSTGAAHGPDFQVNTYTYYRQNYPAVASAANGDFVVVWVSDYQDTDYSSGVFGQRFGDPGATTTTSTTTIPSTTTTTLPSGCTPAPMEGCYQQTMARRGGVSLKDKSPDIRDRLRWRWVRGSETEVEDFGDPFDEDTEYAMCIYDASGNPQPLSQQVVPGGGTCPGRPCWKQLGEKRFEYWYRDTGGFLKVFLKGGEEGRARVGVTGKGDPLDVPQLPLEPPVTVQFQAPNGNCWEARYGTYIRKNTSDTFRAKPGVM